MMTIMEWSDRVKRYGFPVFIVVAIAAGAAMMVAILHRAPPVEPQSPAAQASSSAAPSTTASIAASIAASKSASMGASAPNAAPVRLAVVGGGSVNGNSPDFLGKKLGDTSWVLYAAGNGVDFVGGWADPGASTQRMATGTRAVPADVLVIGIGVADAQKGVPFSATTANIDRVVKTINAPRVILAGAPPVDASPDTATTVNNDLQQLAKQRGWTYVDAAAGVREGTKYAAGMSDDGVNPNAAGAKIIGAAVRRAVLAT
jgi:lysophospholipase L1-like esterase